MYIFGSFNLSSNLKNHYLIKVLFNHHAVKTIPTNVIYTDLNDYFYVKV